MNRKKWEEKMNETQKEEMQKYYVKRKSIFLGCFFFFILLYYLLRYLQYLFQYPPLYLILKPFLLLLFLS